MRGLGQCGVGAEGTAQDTARNRYEDLGICVHVHTCMYSNIVMVCILMQYCREYHIHKLHFGDSNTYIDA